MINIIAPPLIGGIIALSTNWLAIKMLFHPHQPKYIFGLRIPFTPGLIPKEWHRLTKKIAQAVAGKLLTPEVLVAELKRQDNWHIPNITLAEALEKAGIDQPHHTIATHTATALKQTASKLLQNIPPDITLPPDIDHTLLQLTSTVIEENLGTLAKMFISKEKIYHSIKSNIIAYLTNPAHAPLLEEKAHQAIDHILATPQAENILHNMLNINLQTELNKKKHLVAQVLEIVATYIAHNMPIEAMIENKLNTFAVHEAEELLLSVAGRELKLIILLGGVLGFFIGLFNLLL